ncbi:MAG: discoidin domain-containing protein, partial [Candidatus Thermoplasmatota archaeon]|nr:discoidin domain-containing protein [Candidatus Thermoplasmatota archaeon]
MRPWLSRILSLAVTLFLLIVMFQAPQAAATLPSDPSYLNFAAASNGGTATASTWTSGYEPSKAIDESSSTMWRATSTDALLIDFADAYDLREIHIHMASYAMPEVELYLKDGTGGKVFAIVGGFFGF